MEFVTTECIDKHANIFAKNCGDPCAHSKHSASIAATNKNMGNQNSSWIVILHGVINDAHKFPVVFSRIFHTG